MDVIEEWCRHSDRLSAPLCSHHISSPVTHPLGIPIVNQQFFPPERQTNEPDSGSPAKSLLSCKTINVEVPEAVYWHIRRCATESKMSMKEFMGLFCGTATPISANCMKHISVGHIPGSMNFD